MRKESLLAARERSRALLGMQVAAAASSTLTHSASSATHSAPPRRPPSAAPPRLAPSQPPLSARSFFPLTMAHALSRRMLSPALPWLALAAVLMLAGTAGVATLGGAAPGGGGRREGGGEAAMDETDAESG
ncbi:hypothetical protein CLOM_g616 [Closterium sp. NIES-68]|nr:hypothetical protein CLOM_g616 [Closterium sp. NIES-68]GJP75476.1 hypothetical protein CLOP_g5917 [Closterium sp. NIES-67]